MTPDELRAWFDERTAAHFAEPLLGRFQVRAVTRAAWLQSFDAVKDEIFPGDAGLDITQAWTDADRARFRVLNAIFAEPLEHNLIIVDTEDGDAEVGWAQGVQGPRATYYMAITGVHPRCRGKGLYPAYLKRLLPLLAELGFREAESRHSAHNNAVLIPKLRAGFIISAFEIAANYGLLVHLRYTFSDAMRQLYAWRVDGRVGGESLRAQGILKG